MISDEERELRMRVVRRLAVAMAGNNEDPILSEISFLTHSTVEGRPRSEEDLDSKNPCAIQPDGGRYYEHVRKDGRGQLNIIWPSGTNDTFKFHIPDGFLESERDVKAIHATKSSNDNSPNEEDDSDDSWIQVTSAAISIRAIEKVNGDALTDKQLQLYLSNYNGKYPLKIAEAGTGLIISLRKPPPKSIFAKLFGSPSRVDPNNKMDVLIDQGADHVLSLHGAREEIKWLLDHEMRYPPSSKI